MPFRSRIIACVLASLTAFGIATAHADPTDGDGDEDSTTVFGHRLGLPDLRCPVDATYLRRPFVFGLKALETTTKQLAGYKSDADVDAYIKCWSDDPKLRAEYLRIRKYVKAAAEASGVPFSILACLFFKESHYEKGVVSPVGAIGLAQMMPGTWKDQLSHLTVEPSVRSPYVASELRRGVKSDGGPLDQVVKKIEAIYASFYKNKKLSDPVQIRKVRDLIGEYRRLRGLSGKNNAGDSYTSLQLMTNALRRAEVRKIFAEYAKKLGHEPRSRSASDPEIAAIVGAYYLKVDVFQQIFEKDRHYRYPSHDRWIIATGAYNVGPGAMKCGVDMTADQCIAATKIEETRKQMASVRNCSEHGNKTPMWGDEKMKGCYR